MSELPLFLYDAVALRQTEPRTPETMEKLTYLLADEKNVRRHLLPLTFTRPVALLRVGIVTLQEKWNRLLGEDAGFWVEDYLQGKFAAQPAQAANAEKAAEKDGKCLMINASVIPDATLAEAIAKLRPDEILVPAGAGNGDGNGDGNGGPATEKSNLPWIAFYQNTSRLTTYESGLCQDGRKPMPYDGKILQIGHLWDIFTHNGKQIEEDLSAIAACRPGEPLQGEGVTRMGDYPVYAEVGARADHCLIDTTEGPVYLGRNSRVMPGTYIKGPLALCENSLIKVGAKIYGGCTFGPHCKVAGEVESSVMTGYSNKAHDGFLGDAVLGEWCNLGAGTNCSNLKNDYSPVRVWSYAEERFVKTGLQFCGLFMGDHAKSAIGTQFNTGTVVGVAANVFAAGFPKNFIPSFTWGKETYRVERAIDTAKAVWARRNKEFNEREADILRHIYQQTVENRARSQSEDA